MLLGDSYCIIVQNFLEISHTIAVQGYCESFFYSLDGHA